MILSLERSTSPPVDLMMELEVRPLHPDFGVEILSVDLSMPLEYERFAQIERAVEHYSVVLFRGQSFDDDSQLAFSRRFGALEYGHVAYGRDRSIEYVGRIGNIDKNGKQLPSKHKKVVFSTGNEMWHSDSSFREVPARLSISYAHEVTPDGGELEFVSTRPAYARLPPDLKETLANLVAIHDYTYSRSKVGEDVVSASLAASLPPVPQKLVRTNQATGAKNYYVGSHARSIEGWRDEDARVLLDDLVARATIPEHRYQHSWQVGDLLIWDNRCVLHRGMPYDADRYRRRMHQTRVAGLCSSLVEG
jgi:alpha-ketoglutarate-dependent 2,4-dichlorophenoxyacetate dioxygenase